MEVVWCLPFLGVSTDVGALDYVRRVLRVPKGLAGGVGYWAGNANPSMLVSEQLTRKQCAFVGNWLYPFLFALTGQCKSLYWDQGDKGCVPGAIPTALWVVLGKSLICWYLSFPFSLCLLLLSDALGTATMTLVCVYTTLRWRETLSTAGSPSCLLSTHPLCCVLGFSWVSASTTCLEVARLGYLVMAHAGPPWCCPPKRGWLVLWHPESRGDILVHACLITAWWWASLLLTASLGPCWLVVWMS